MRSIRSLQRCGVGNYPWKRKKFSATSIERRVLTSLLETCTVQANNTILLCVSGGCDSMSLLHIVQRLRQEWQPQLACHVIHFNHKVRPESDEEEEFVRSWSKQYGMPYHVYASPPTQHSASDGFQSNSRYWRRSHCETIASSLPHCLVATAHHRDDQVETVLMKLLRGVSLPHLHGMLPRSGNYIKPLLTVSKQELQAYMEERKLKWYEDSSNAKPVYTRNRVRLELVPLMTSIAGGDIALKKRIETLSSESLQLKSWQETQVAHFIDRAKDRSWLQHNDDFVSLAITDEWHEYSPMIQCEIVRCILGFRMSLRDVSHEHITAIALTLCQGRFTKYSLPDEHTAIISPRQLRIESRTSSEECTTTCKSISVSYSKMFSVSVDVVNPQFTSHHSDASSAFSASGPWKVVLHSIPRNSHIAIRRRQDGDVIQANYHNKLSFVKIKRFLIDNKVPRHLRCDIPIITMNDQIISVPPLIAAQYTENARIGESVSLVLHICRKIGSKV